MSEGAATIGLPFGTLDALLPMHLVVGPDGTIGHAGRTFRKVCPEAQIEGRALFDILEVERPLKLVGVTDPAALIGARLRLRFRRKGGGTLKGVVTPLAPADGFLIDLSFSISVVSSVAEFGLSSADFAESDQTVEMLYLAEANAAVVSEARRLIRRLELARDAAALASLTDGLTGLGNRRALDGWLTARVQGGQPFALLQIDLDYFKAVNDTHGHGAGDAVLQTTARRLQRMLRPGDDLARAGGDEFVALIGSAVDGDRIAHLADRLIAEIEEPVRVGGVTCRISASIGAALSTSYAAPTLERMLADADAALYDVKRSGRGRARINSV